MQSCGSTMPGSQYSHYNSQIVCQVRSQRKCVWPEEPLPDCPKFEESLDGSHPRRIMQLWRTASRPARSMVKTGSTHDWMQCAMEADDEEPDETFQLSLSLTCRSFRTLGETLQFKLYKFCSTEWIWRFITMSTCAKLHWSPSAWLGGKGWSDEADLQDRFLHCLALFANSDNRLVL